ncbi:hypothetical protein SteCoe_4337 [Stentor coeruleus]|uniref:Uncharacterized protein n=1 Tax=Stentor coeruleus TaxID=5963 RepID=A0A1R2CUV9_9CILI|nr:hypothetical protein SteCoe_4337 [Stentor coeruleus]
MQLKFRFPWYARLPLLLLSLNIIPLYLYGNTYILFGGIGKMRRGREKNYSQVRYKKEEDVQVHTTESEELYRSISAGKIPQPNYSRFPSEEEVIEHGLYIIGKDSIKEKDN